MRVTEINSAASGSTGFGRHDSTDFGAAEPAERRALVALEQPAASRREHSPVYREAAFMAQLIATKDQHPQTRERRRAEADEVLAAYRNVTAITDRH